MTAIDTYFSANDPLHAAKLFIDTGAIKKNYQKLQALCSRARCASVVKADAYGLGASEIAPILFQEGCRDFFVAQPQEGADLRALLPTARIMILNGLYEGAADFYDTHQLIPVLNTSEQVHDYVDFARKTEKKLSALIHIDTGMNRLGLPLSEVDLILGNEKTTSNLDILYLMTHLACGDVADHDMNTKQAHQFKSILEKYPGYKASFANSAGIINNPLYHFDLARAGIAIYGGTPSDHENASMSPVVHLRSRFLQIRQIDPGDTVGYGATWVATKPGTIGILPIGYADGFARLHGAPTKELRGQVFINGKFAPIIGRVSMDLMAVDISALASKPGLRNMDVEILGAHITIDELAESAQTIGYEVLTNLGKRYKRHYADVI